MSDAAQQDYDMPGPTQPVEEHKWLQRLVGNWTYETIMPMGPDKEPMKTTGTEKVESLGGLWAFAEMLGAWPDGRQSKSYLALGYDVSFKEYRGCFFMDMSSHLWKYTGSLSEDGNTMTLDCEGPSMEKDGETALYRDVIDIIDENHRTYTSFGQDDKGEWQEFMKTTYTRA